MNEKVKWCKEQKQGITLIEPNDNLAQAYYENAEETPRITNQIKNSGSNMWLATQKYYIEYFAAYSLLMKIGIKCEIHSCTIEIIKILEENQVIDFNLSGKLEKDKNLRIKNQYYLKNIEVEINSQELSNLILNIKKTLDEIKKEDIIKIREQIK